jgi:hypothetical protein
MYRYFGTALTAVAGALAIVGVAQTAAQALAQPPTCQLSSTDRCVLKSFNVVPNPNDPGVYVLQLDTTGGPHAFAADLLWSVLGGSCWTL